MPIEIPKSYMGEPIKGAMDRILKGSPERKSEAKSKKKSSGFTPSPSKLPDAEKYIILEGRQHGTYSYPDMLVPMEKSYFNKNWNKTHEALSKDGAYMLTIRQFADFLTLLKSGKVFDGNGFPVGKGRLEAVLSDIVEVRDPWRAEWLDAKFEDGNIIYHKLDGTNLVEVKEPLSNYIKTDKDPGISLNDWLTKANDHGLPTPKTNKGSMYYWAPVDGSVAGFYANSGGAVLSCYRNPTSSYSSLGVRASRAKI